MDELLNKNMAFFPYLVREISLLFFNNSVRKIINFIILFEMYKYFFNFFHLVRCEQKAIECNEFECILLRNHDPIPLPGPSFLAS